MWVGGGEIIVVGVMVGDIDGFGSDFVFGRVSFVFGFFGCMSDEIGGKQNCYCCGMNYF